MPIPRQKLKRMPIIDQEIISNRVETFGRGRVTIVELETKDGFMGVGQCRMSDEDMRNPNFRPDKIHAFNTAKWRAADSIVKQRAGKPVHDPLAR